MWPQPKEKKYKPRNKKNLYISTCQLSLLISCHHGSQMYSEVQGFWNFCTQHWYLNIIKLKAISDMNTNKYLSYWLRRRCFTTSVWWLIFSLLAWIIFWRMMNFRTGLLFTPRRRWNLDKVRRCYGISASLCYIVTTVYSFKQDKIWISTENNSNDINYKMRNIFTLFHLGHYTIVEQWRNTHTHTHIYITIYERNCKCITRNYTGNFIMLERRGDTDWGDGCLRRYSASLLSFLSWLSWKCKATNSCSSSETVTSSAAIFLRSSWACT